MTCWRPLPSLVATKPTAADGAKSIHTEGARESRRFSLLRPPTRNRSTRRRWRWPLWHQRPPPRLAPN